MFQNAPNCTIQKKFRGSMPPNPLANAWLCHTSQLPPPPPKKKNWPPALANPAYAHELYYSEIYLRIHHDRQLIVCSTLYVYALQNLFRGQKMTKIVAQHILKCITWALFSKYYVSITSMFKLINGGAAL